MKIEDVRRNAYSMPLNNPSFPPGPYRYFNREYFVISYRTDPEAPQSRSSVTSSSACPTPPASAITPKPAR
jgi:acetoacetate decarboxylase